MAEAKVSLHDQKRAVERAVDEIQAVYGASALHAAHPTLLRFETNALRAAARTLAYMREHEQTIRDAISSARTVDDPQDTR
jgi:hypothetical protein